MVLSTLSGHEQPLLYKIVDGMNGYLANGRGIHSFQIWLTPGVITAFAGSVQLS
jgi:hypothetical protein